MQASLAQVTAQVNTLGEEYRSGKTQSKATLRKLKAAIARKVELQEAARVA
jgi:hypothetical protein